MRKSTNLTVRNITVTAIAAGLLTAGAAMAQQPTAQPAPVPVNVNSGAAQQANVAAATWQASVEELQISTEKVPFIILKLYDHDSLLRMRISFRCLHMSVESRRLKKT